MGSVNYALKHTKLFDGVPDKYKPIPSPKFQNVFVSDDDWKHYREKVTECISQIWNAMPKSASILHAKLNETETFDAESSTVDRSELHKAVGDWLRTTTSENNLRIPLHYSMGNFVKVRITGDVRD